MFVIGLNDGPFLVFTFGISNGQVVLEDTYENKIPRIVLNVTQSNTFLNAIIDVYELKTENVKHVIEINSTIQLHIERELHKEATVYDNYCSRSIKIVLVDGYTVVGYLPIDGKKLCEWLNKDLHEICH